MGTDLTRIGEKARKEPQLVFTSLYHHITDIDNLRACYDGLLANKASGGLVGWPTPGIRIDLNPFRRAEAR